MRSAGSSGEDTLKVFYYATTYLIVNQARTWHSKDYCLWQLKYTANWPAEFEKHDICKLYQNYDSLKSPEELEFKLKQVWFSFVFFVCLS